MVTLMFLLLGLQLLSAARSLQDPQAPDSPASIFRSSSSSSSHTISKSSEFAPKSSTLSSRRERIHEPKSNRSWSSDVIYRNVRKPWRSIPDTSHVHFVSPTNRSGKALKKRTGRFSDFAINDEGWAHLADESAPPYFSPIPGLNFPIFQPLLGEGRHRNHHSPPPYQSPDYDRQSASSPSEGRSRSPTNNYYDPPKGGRNQLMPPPPPPPPPPVSNPRDRQRYRPDKMGMPPVSGGGRNRGRGRGKNNDYGPPESSYYPEYDDGVPHYSYNPAETPRCAKESNVSYCIEDTEYPIETMQYEIDRDSSILEQIMPEADEKMELVEGLPKKEDEKYNFRHYFTYRVDELENVTDTRPGHRGHKEEVQFALKPDYYKDGGYICPSIVTYVQPRRARNTEGLWKVILNLRERYKGQDYKQNVRLEQCMYSGRECSFTSSFYNSQCIQKYNNHRLLAWTEEKGIHLDVFRLPVACSCHFKGKTVNN